MKNISHAQIVLSPCFTTSWFCIYFLYVDDFVYDYGNSITSKLELPQFYTKL